MVVPATAGPPGPPPQITIEAIEVSQAIQDLTMSVRLIAGKPTVVRVYLGTSFGPVVVIAALRVTSVADPNAQPDRLSDRRRRGRHRREWSGRDEAARDGEEPQFPLASILARPGDWTIGLETLERIDQPQLLGLPGFPYPVVTFEIVRSAADPRRRHSL